MTTFRYLFAPIALLAAVPAMAQQGQMGGMKMDVPAEKKGHGVGVITAIDPKAGSLTIRHGPIAALNWPGMTMSFKANPATLLRGLKVGQRIGFDLKASGMTAQVTAVQAQ